jgi:DNA mismatch repair protein MutL
VKELVENALDAGANDICIEIRQGGRQLIRITDNGCGMGSDDALLCLERHATSKIRSAEDIHEIMSMGFRGEAVPSIAAISKFTILTKPQDNEMVEGTMVLVEGGKILKCCPAACSSGTTIEVKSLFFNIPVRKKFQKSPIHDVNEILKIVTLLALGYPHIKFRLISDQETILSAPSSQNGSSLDILKERIGSVLGGDYIEGCLPIDVVKEDYKISGWIGSPLHHRQNRTGQYLFINQRGIQSPLVSFAVKDGYGTTIPAQRHPIYVLHLTMSGALVDVNVHPQKREVRLRQEALLRETVMTAVREAIQATNVSFIAEVPVAEMLADAPPPAFFPSFSPPPFSPIDISSAALNSPEAPSLTHAWPSPLRPAEETNFHFPEYKPLKRIPRVIASIPCYLILEDAPDGIPSAKTGLCLVDQRAAHARVIYEQLRQHREKQPLEIQTLLIPHTIELPSTEAMVLKQHIEMLQASGIHLKEFGHNAFLLDSLPQIMGNIDPSLFIKEIVSELMETDRSHPVAELIDKRIAQAAVRASIAKDKRLSTAEGQVLVKQLLECGTPWYSPHGKPTIATMSLEEISKHFS